jgi:g-D-glutamyl-meso-diaminopimelate peptidase
MQFSWTKKALLLTLLFVVVFLVVVGGLIYFVKKDRQLDKEVTVVTPDPTLEMVSKTRQTIGASVEGRPIEVAVFGDGAKDVLFVGGIHGGYEYNSVALAEQFIAQYKTNPEIVPEGFTIHIIPSLNPDGVAVVVGGDTAMLAQSTVPGGDPSGFGRFNANEVDLNRNFDCKWQAESTWRGNPVSAGTYAFSEPEAVALRTFIEANPPEVVAFWHSQANNVYASECEDGVLPETLQVMETYAVAGDYGQVPVFDAYPITGDAEGWLASLGIPAVTVELETHNSIEWSRNLAGTQALINQYSIAK